jgi:hypothetical protein
MRSFGITFILAGLLVSAVHWLPLKTDSFTVVRQGNESVKVFRQGWPLSYVASGERPDSVGAIALKATTNFVVFSVTISFVLKLVSLLRKREAKRLRPR